jgi:hypothetical protein
MDAVQQNSLGLHPQVMAAIIAALVSAFAAVITLLGARWQLRTKLVELVEVSSTGWEGMKSLTGAMKDDLGSYAKVAIRADSSVPG